MSLQLCTEKRAPRGVPTGGQDDNIACSITYQTEKEEGVELTQK